MKKINPGLNQSRLFFKPMHDAKGEMIKKRTSNKIKKSSSEE